MKKIFFFAATCLAFAACSNESLVDDTFGGQRDGAIKFIMNQKNMTRAYTDMQKTGHYNFGVFGYKNTDKDIPVMPNYLVGYYDDNLAYQKSGSTVGDKEGQVDGKSYWMYEGMGTSEYAGTYAGGELTDAFKSNNANQYLKFWDNAASQYCFYAYAPYLNTAANGGKTANYVDGVAKDPSNDTYVLTIPEDLLVAGYDDASLSEYMYASKKVERGSYGLDVPLHFNRLNAKVNIKFWEDIKGYKVRILDLKEGTLEGVQAAASIKKTSDATAASYYTPYGYRAGKFYLKNGVKIQFDANAEKQAMHQFVGTIAAPAAADKNTQKVLKFKSPTAAEIGETRFTAAESPTTYYAIPKGDGAQVLTNGSNNITDLEDVDTDLAKTGFTFHVSYELTAEDTGERIRVNNATVHVPADYCNWKNNTHYTYIFKITKNSNGTTINPNDPNAPTIDPTDPEVPEVQALYPIVFDNCTVQDWEEIEGEWNISDGNNLAYHDVQLTTYSLASGDITVTVTDNDKWDGHAINYSKITVTGPGNADVTSWYNDGTHVISVPTDAALGVYTVTYECTGAPASTTHPAKWSETFYVGDSYTVATHVTEIGTGAAAKAYLDITAKKGSEVTTSAASAAGQLKIEYPKNIAPAYVDKVYVDGEQVVVEKNAAPGAYKLIYTVNQGKEVKVAEQIFNVVDYNFTLSTYKVFLNGTAQNVVANVQAPASPVTGVVTATGFTVTGNSVAVPNTTAEDTYTVTYTVGTGAEKTVYTNQFKVANTHAVAVSQTTLQSQKNWDNVSDFAADFLWITTTFNGVNATADEGDVLTIEDAAGTDVTANFSITWDDTEKKYKLQAKTSVAPATYFVVYTKSIEGADTKTKAQVIVTK